MNKLRYDPIYLSKDYYEKCNRTIDPRVIILERKADSDVCIEPFSFGPISPDKYKINQADDRCNSPLFKGKGNGNQTFRV